jgi:hypothetical protein
MPKYEFKGPEAFARRVAGAAGRPDAEADIVDNPEVAEIADQIEKMQAERDQAKRNEIRKQVAEDLDHRELVSATIKAMVDEAFPALGFSRPSNLKARAVTSPRERPSSPRAEFQHPTDEEGNPVTLDPNNPDHAEQIEQLRAIQEEQSDPSIMAREMAGNWQEESALRAELAVRGITDADLMRGSPRAGDLERDPEISADEIDREYDRYEKSGAAERERAEARRQQTIRATGIDVGMSGGPPRPNTGKNQDFNQRDVPTQFDKPTQAQDPFQEGNPPYIDPNQTDHGQSILRRQGPGTGTGLTEGAIKAAAGVPYDQTEPPDPVPLDLPSVVPPESAHPTLGGESAPATGKPRGAKPK